MKKIYLIAFTFFLYAFAKAQDATYTITFDATWSQTSHPHSSGSLPSNAHWSRLVGTTHNSDIAFLEMGELSTPGIENVAELGNNDIFMEEVNEEIASGNAFEWIDLGNLSSSSGQIIGEIQVSEEFSLLTLVAMIAPSPDWIIAINSFPLIDENQNWIEEIAIDLYPYDAGTDSGADYTSNNLDTNPAQPISSLQGVTPFSQEKIGTLTITLNEVLGVPENVAEDLAFISPNPSDGLFNIHLMNNKGSINLYDLNGRLLNRTAINQGNNTIDYTYLSSGIFLVSVESEGRKVTQKLVIR